MRLLRWSVYGLVAAAAVAVWVISPTRATETTVPPLGIRENTPSVYALEHARIVVAPGKIIENGTIVIRDGIISAVGTDALVPSDARVQDMTGKMVYPGLIDAYTELGGARPPTWGQGDQGRRFEGAGMPVSKGGANYWNSNVVPQTRADAQYQLDSAANKTCRSQGITARLVAPAQGIIKGTSALVSTRDNDGTRTILKNRVALHAALMPRASWGEENYPTSPMGAMTLVRQAFYDAEWYRQAWDAYQKDRRLPRPERNDALEALQGYAGGSTPVIIDASNYLYCLRADQVGREFNLKIILRGSGEEYQRLDAVKAIGRGIILPLEYPKTPNVKTPEDALGVSLEELMHWDIAPENAGRLARAGIPIAFMSQGLKDPQQFLAGVRKAVRRGLDPDAALRALTLTPAEWYEIADRLGTLESGKAANMVVTDGELFADKTQVLETWVDGERYENKSLPPVDPRGTWRMKLSEKQGPADTITLLLKGDLDKLSGSIRKNGKESRLSEVGINDVRLGFSFKGDSLGWPGVARMSATLSGGVLLGTGNWPEGGVFGWTGERAAPYVPEPDTSKPKPVQMAGFPVDYPFGAWGFSGAPPQPDAVLFRNATVWTCGPQGKIVGGSVLVRAGKIAAVGKDMAAPPEAQVVDLAGKHLTPGIIDCHSHIATDGGINESGHTVTAEVRIGDFIDPTDLDIYRQLGGGVTASHILHGSANTIGGQVQVIKLRWGALPEDMKFAGAPLGIKFALGENVKQSNWGDRYRTRYPQTRMGAEQIVRDEFAAARDYKSRWAEWNKRHVGAPPRRDLQLDAIAEILDGKRFIHCHAYRQDEILALMRTCEAYNVRVKTFQHILEGYKVADVMAKHGAGGSSFSDWWAYKIEVYDAIPYNGALMKNAGVLVSFNSDSGELARRLNTEAAKAVKYGGVPEEEALKFVTLNSAIQLGIDKQVGSIEPGKDADLAVWSGPPLSDLSICEQTWIDGRRYFDRGEDAQRRADVEKMRATLIQKVLLAGDEAAPTGGERKRMWPREDVFDAHSEHTMGGR